MTIDASIPLQQVAPTVADMLANGNAYQQLKTTDQAQQLTQNKLNAINAVGSVNRNDYSNDADYNKAINSATAQAGSANLAPQYRAENARANAEEAHAQHDQFETHNKALTQNYQAVASLMSNPKVSKQDALSVLDERIKAGTVAPDQAETIKKSIEGAEDTPASIKNVLHPVLGQMISAEQQLITPEWVQKPNGNWVSMNKNALAPGGVAELSQEIEPGGMKTYTDEHGITKTVPMAVYNKRVVEEAGKGGSNGLQEGSSPYTKAAIERGNAALSTYQEASNKATQSNLGTDRALDLIANNKDANIAFGTTAPLAQKVTSLVKSLFGKDINQNDSAAISDFASQLKQMGIPVDSGDAESIKKSLYAIKAKNIEATEKHNAALNWSKAHGDDPSSMTDFEIQWNNHIDPNYLTLKAFEQRGDKKAFNEKLNSLTPAQKARVEESGNFIKNANTMPSNSSGNNNSQQKNTVITRGEYESLPSGSRYHHPDDKPGVFRTKK